MGYLRNLRTEYQHMPAIVTHHLFGLEVYRELSSIIGITADERDAFLLGNHGPDPLLFLRALPSSRETKRLGGIMHSQRPSELLFFFHRVFVNSQESVLRAYAFGFLCHYLLDSTVHPLVFAQQRAYCDSGLEGLSREHDWHGIHFLIEAELDEYALASKFGVTVGQLVPHREILRCSRDVLLKLSAAYPQIALEVNGGRIAKTTFAFGTELYRAAQLFLDMRRTPAGKLVNYASLAGRRYLIVDALTHSGRLRHDTPFANDDHVPWPHHHNEGEVVSESFDELYDAALERALELVPKFAQENVSLDECRFITRNRNFSGKLLNDVPIDRETHNDGSVL